MRALLSVFDKRGLVPFAQGLTRLGFELLSTGGTFEALKMAQVPVTAISHYTGSPEILDGRVKTLHPKIYGGILGRPFIDSDCAELADQNIECIALVVANFYPFAMTVAQGAPRDAVLEQIDIGGPSMVRAAAKNAAHVTVIVDPDDYKMVLSELKSTKTVNTAMRQRLQHKAFAYTASYDVAIAHWLGEQEQTFFPQSLAVSLNKVKDLRYGENPHQKAAFYRQVGAVTKPTVASSAVLQGKELSYNNLLDLDTALSLVLEFSHLPTAVIVKHNTPCGVASDVNLQQAYHRARAVDELSSFGGIVALNREVDSATASAITETFIEAVIAPTYSMDARKILAAKQNLRLLSAGTELAHVHAKPLQQRDLRSISGGILAMERDAVEPRSEWNVVTKRVPTPEEWEALKFAWRVCKYVKSNAIVFAHKDELLAQAGGQTSRVDAVRIAAGRGGARLVGSAVASDAFFPFSDGLDALIPTGVSCVVQPGGAVRDADIIATADDHGLAMLFTGIRHFRH